MFPEHSNLKNRLLFITSTDKDPYAAFIKENNPINNFEKIRTLVEKGYIIRTRTDYDTVQARGNDHTQKQFAFNSGAQLISTDYIEANFKFSNYTVKFANNDTLRINPITKDIAKCKL